MRVDCDDCGKIVEEKDLIPRPFGTQICTECFDLDIAGKPCHTVNNPAQPGGHDE